MGVVLVTGANGMVGSAVLQSFERNGSSAVGVTREEVDLRNSKDTLQLFAKHKIDLLVHCAALVGGIKANIEGGSRFFIENWEIDNSVLTAARSLQIHNLIYLGSSCMYPVGYSHAVREIDLLSGPLEKTNYNFALAKILGAQITQSIAQEYNLNWKVLIPSNLYGPRDHFNDERSHLLSAVISKLVLAKKSGSVRVEMWGDGSPKREFTYVEDFADWIYEISNCLEKLPSLLNVGSGEEYSILEYYQLVAASMNYQVEIVSNLNFPNGNARKLMDSGKARTFGWMPKTSIRDGLEKTIDWYMSFGKEVN